jgi:hypothetical protein
MVVDGAAVGALGHLFRQLQYATATSAQGARFAIAGKQNFGVSIDHE